MQTSKFQLLTNARLKLIQINTKLQNCSVQYLNCNTRMCVTIKRKIKVLKRKIKVLKKKKPHPDPDEIIMKLSPRIVLDKTQESKEVPRWSSCVTHLPAVWHRARVSCCTDNLFMFNIQII